MGLHLTTDNIVSAQQLLQKVIFGGPEVDYAIDESCFVVLLV